MRRLVVSVLLFVAACATAPAQADPIAADPALLETCIASANGDDAALQTCRGAVARPCMEAEGPSTMSAVLCWSAEADAWRSAMDAAVSRLGINLVVLMGTAGGGADAFGGFCPSPDRGYTLVALVAGDGTAAREGGADLVVSLPFDPGTFVSELLAGMKA